MLNKKHTTYLPVTAQDTDFCTPNIYTAHTVQ